MLYLFYQALRKTSLVLLLVLIASVLDFSVAPIATAAPSKKKTARAQKIIKTGLARIEKDPEDEEAILALGKAYYVLEDYSNATKYLRQVDHKEEPDAFRLYVLALEKTGNLPEIIRILKQMIASNPKNTSHLKNLGRAYRMNKNYDDAVATYKTAIKIKTNDIAAYYGLLDVFAATNDAYESRIILKDMIKKFGAKPDFLTRLCKVDYEDGFFETALVYCQKAISEDSDIPENHIHLAMTLKYTKKQAQALKILQHAARQFDDSELTQWTAAKEMFERNDTKKGIKYLHRCVKADASSTRCVVGLAESYYSIKRYKDALKFFVQACAMDTTTRTKFSNALSALRLNREKKWIAPYNKAYLKCNYKGGKK
jgi:tetratricopeptide (TPR) repeat protein